MTREQVIKLVNDNGILPDSKFGQNFLCDDNICHEIVDLCDVNSDDIVLEIGPGIGALTRILVEQSDHVTAIEIDKRLAEVLRNDSELNSLNLIVSDFLKVDSDTYKADTYTKVMSNIPYYVMTPIMVKLMSECTSCKAMSFMVEDAAIARIIAKPGTKQYGPLSVLVSLYGSASREFTVPANCFIPAPHTTSAVISLYHDNDNEISVELADFIEACFSMRRKKLLNSLSNYCSNHSITNLKETLINMGIREDVRAENLTPSEFYELFRLIHQ